MNIVIDFMNRAMPLPWPSPNFLCGYDKCPLEWPLYDGWFMYPFSLFYQAGALFVTALAAFCICIYGRETYAKRMGQKIAPDSTEMV